MTTYFNVKRDQKMPELKGKTDKYKMYTQVALHPQYISDRILMCYILKG